MLQNTESKDHNFPKMSQRIRKNHADHLTVFDKSTLIPIAMLSMSTAALMVRRTAWLELNVLRITDTLSGINMDDIDNVERRVVAALGFAERQALTFIIKGETDVISSRVDETQL